MATSRTGFQPRNTPAERRAFFDLDRRLRNVGALLRHSSVQLSYAWSNATTIADPGGGRVLVDNVTPTAATRLAIEVFDFDGIVRPSLMLLSAHDEITLYRADSLTHWARYRITAEPIAHGDTWYEIPVEFVAAGAGGFTPANNARIEVVMQPLA